jgi:hypothetical protein
MSRPQEPFFPLFRDQGTCQSPKIGVGVQSTHKSLSTGSHTVFYLLALQEINTWGTGKSSTPGLLGANPTVFLIAPRRGPGDLLPDRTGARQHRREKGVRPCYMVGLNLHWGNCL